MSSPPELEKKVRAKSALKESRLPKPATQRKAGDVTAEKGRLPLHFEGAALDRQSVQDVKTRESPSELEIERAMRLVGEEALGRGVAKNVVASVGHSELGSPVMALSVFDRVIRFLAKWLKKLDNAIFKKKNRFLPRTDLSHLIPPTIRGLRKKTLGGKNSDTGEGETSEIDSEIPRSQDCPSKSDEALDSISQAKAINPNDGIGGSGIPADSEDRKTDR